MSFKDCVYPLSFRKYQIDMLEVFEKQKDAGDTIYHYVAPPGSGKTMIGLELIRRLGKKAVVFSPNQAIQSQWISRLNELTQEATASDDPDSQADLLSLTYQIISVKNSEGKLHDNAKVLIDKLKERTTIVLDECHHLTAHWAKVLESLLKRDVHVIGLTATPPFHKTRKDVSQYERLLGPVDYEILLPPVVREGYLAPYQDLVYVVEPTETEVELLKHISQRFEELLLALKENEKDPPLHFWCETFVQAPDIKDTPLTFYEAFAQNPVLLKGLVKFIRDSHLEIPPSIPPMPEFEDPLTFQELISVLEQYALRVLFGSSKSKKLLKQMKETLKAVGFSLTSSGLKPVEGGLKSLLSFSRSKTLGAREVLRQELRNQGEDLRALVLTDFEVNDKLLGSKDYREGTSAVDVLKLLVEDSETDDLDPIMITGKTLWVDDDLLDSFMAWAQTYLEERDLKAELKSHLKEGFYEIEGRGSGWNTRTYVAFVTRMLEQGITKCLVSTKNLLGEGWDSLKLNTLLDLTVVSSFAYVNQIRGRTIRLDPSNPHKTANNWDVLTIHGESLQGGYDLERLQEKYSQFYGICKDGVIEKGLGHTHPLLVSGTVKEVAFHRKEINANMLDKAFDRLQTYRSWQVGKKYFDMTTYDVEISYHGPIKYKNWTRGFIHKAAKTVLRSMKKLKECPRWSRYRWETREDGSWRFLLKTSKGSRLFASSMEELLTRVDQPRYALGLDNNPLHVMPTTILPLPSYFAKNKKRAQVFKSKWPRFLFSKIYLLTSSKVRDKNLLNKWIGKKALPIRVRQKEVWM